MSVILITGASGSVGRHLSNKLSAAGHTIKTLSVRSSNNKIQQKAFLWNLKTQFIEQNALNDVEIIIHLAGAGVAARRWSKAYKDEILLSRAGAAEFLLKNVVENSAPLKKFISMSGVGYYPDPGDTAYTESGPAGKSFMAEVCKKWEEAAFRFESTGASVSALRTAPVLTKDHGLLKAYLYTHFTRVIPTLGSPEHILSWIHIEDLCEFIVKLTADPEMHGIYNMTAPQPVTQREFVHAIDKVTGTRSWHPNVPDFALRLALGERAALPLTDQKVLPARALESGYQFRFPTIETALYDLIGNS